MKRTPLFITLGIAIFAIVIVESYKQKEKK
jgi:hypothetical protein